MKVGGFIALDYISLSLVWLITWQLKEVLCIVCYTRSRINLKKEVYYVHGGMKSKRGLQGTYLQSNCDLSVYLHHNVTRVQRGPGWSPCQPEFALISAAREQLCVTKQCPSCIPEVDSANSRAFPMGECKRQVAQISPGGAGEGRRESGIELTDDRARVEGWGEKNVCGEDGRGSWKGSERWGGLWREEVMLCW